MYSPYSTGEPSVNKTNNHEKEEVPMSSMGNWLGYQNDRQDPAVHDRRSPFIRTIPDAQKGIDDTL